MSDKLHTRLLQSLNTAAPFLTAVSAISAALAALATCQQASVTNDERRTPYYIALREDKVAAFRNYTKSASDFEASLLRVISDVPYRTDMPLTEMKLTDGQLRDLAQRVNSLNEAHTNFISVINVSGIGWSSTVIDALNKNSQHSIMATRCFPHIAGLVGVKRLRSLTIRDEPPFHCDEATIQKIASNFHQSIDNVMSLMHKEVADIEGLIDSTD